MKDDTTGLGHSRSVGAYSAVVTDQIFTLRSGDATAGYGYRVLRQPKRTTGSTMLSMPRVESLRIGRGMRKCHLWIIQRSCGAFIAAGRIFFRGQKLAQE